MSIVHDEITIFNVDAVATRSSNVESSATHRHIVVCMNGIACARGNGCRVKGGLGAVLVIAEEKRDSYDLDTWKAVVVDGEQIKADTWYTLVNGELVEAEGDLTHE